MTVFIKYLYHIIYIYIYVYIYMYYVFIKSKTILLFIKSAFLDFTRPLYTLRRSFSFICSCSNNC